MGSLLDIITNKKLTDAAPDKIQAKARKFLLDLKNATDLPAEVSLSEVQLTEYLGITLTSLRLVTGSAGLKIGSVSTDKTILPMDTLKGVAKVLTSPRVVDETMGHFLKRYSHIMQGTFFFQVPDIGWNTLNPLARRQGSLAAASTYVSLFPDHATISLYQVWVALGVSSGYLRSALAHTKITPMDLRVTPEQARTLISTVGALDPKNGESYQATSLEVFRRRAEAASKEYFRFVSTGDTRGASAFLKEGVDANLGLPADTVKTLMAKLNWTSIVNAEQFQALMTCIETDLQAGKPAEDPLNQYWSVISGIYKDMPWHTGDARPETGYFDLVKKYLDTPLIKAVGVPDRQFETAFWLKDSVITTLRQKNRNLASPWKLTGYVQQHVTDFYVDKLPPLKLPVPAIHDCLNHKSRVQAIRETLKGAEALLASSEADYPTTCQGLADILQVSVIAIPIWAEALGILPTRSQTHELTPEVVRALTLFQFYRDPRKTIYDCVLAFRAEQKSPDTSASSPITVEMVKWAESRVVGGKDILDLIKQNEPFRETIDVLAFVRLSGCSYVKMVEIFKSRQLLQDSRIFHRHWSTSTKDVIPVTVVEDILQNELAMAPTPVVDTKAPVPVTENTEGSETPSLVTAFLRDNLAAYRWKLAVAMRDAGLSGQPLTINQAMAYNRLNLKNFQVFYKTLQGLGMVGPLRGNHVRAEDAVTMGNLRLCGGGGGRNMEVVAREVVKVYKEYTQKGLDFTKLAFRYQDGPSYAGVPVTPTEVTPKAVPPAPIISLTDILQEIENVQAQMEALKAKVRAISA
jgi:hypothetical protein